MSKYKNKTCVIDGIKFQSIKEGVRYNELKLLEKAGIIKYFNCQPTFLLQDGYKKKDGKIVRPIMYIADFEIFYPDGHCEVEDVKSPGTITQVFRIKRKLLEMQYPEINFKLVL